MILKIVQAGHPVLRRLARDLTPDEVRGTEVQQLIDLMRETMRDAPGVGLAAPQVGLALQVVVIEDKTAYVESESDESRAARLRDAVPFHVLVNPRLTIRDPSLAEHFEGCLSVRGFMAVVPRALGVRVDALDHHGVPVTIEARGWYARILQHEIDHLAGKLYLDRMKSRTYMAEENYRRYWAGVDLEEALTELGEKPSR